MLARIKYDMVGMEHHQSNCILWGSDILAYNVQFFSCISIFFIALLIYRRLCWVKAETSPPHITCLEEIRENNLMRVRLCSCKWEMIANKARALYYIRRAILKRQLLLRQVLPNKTKKRSQPGLVEREKMRLQRTESFSEQISTDSMSYRNFPY
jgi:hypothetical protein